MEKSILSAVAKRIGPGTSRKWRRPWGFKNRLGMTRLACNLRQFCFVWCSEFLPGSVGLRDGYAEAGQGFFRSKGCTSTSALRGLASVCYGYDTWPAAVQAISFQGLGFGERLEMVPEMNWKGRAACISIQPGCIHLGVPQHARSCIEVSASVGLEFAHFEHFEHFDWKTLVRHITLQKPDFKVTIASVEAPFFGCKTCANRVDWSMHEVMKSSRMESFIPFYDFYGCCWGGYSWIVMNCEMFARPLRRCNLRLPQSLRKQNRSSTCNWRTAINTIRGWLASPVSYVLDRHSVHSLIMPYPFARCAILFFCQRLFIPRHMCNEEMLRGTARDIRRRPRVPKRMEWSFDYRQG